MFRKDGSFRPSSGLIMKNSTKKILQFPLILLLVLAVFFSACKKQTTDDTIAYMRVTNASPSLATYNVLVNGSTITSAALPYAGGTSYSSRTYGDYSISFTPASSLVPLYTSTVNLAVSTYTSFYLVNKPGSLDKLTLTDDLSVPATDKAYVRFINLSPDAPAMDVIKSDGTANLFSNRTYKTSSAFIQVDAGSYTLNAKETSTGTVKATLTAYTFTAGYHYDVIYGGMVTPASDSERAVNLQAILIK